MTGDVVENAVEVGVLHVVLDAYDAVFALGVWFDVAEVPTDRLVVYVVEVCCADPRPGSPGGASFIENWIVVKAHSTLRVEFDDLDVVVATVGATRNAVGRHIASKFNRLEVEPVEPVFGSAGEVTGLVDAVVEGDVVVRVLTERNGDVEGESGDAVGGTRRVVDRLGEFELGEDRREQGADIGSEAFCSVEVEAVREELSGFQLERVRDDRDGDCVVALWQVDVGVPHDGLGAVGIVDNDVEVVFEWVPTGWEWRDSRYVVLGVTWVKGARVAEAFGHDIDEAQLAQRRTLIGDRHGECSGLARLDLDLVHGVRVLIDRMIRDERPRCSGSGAKDGVRLAVGPIFDRVCAAVRRTSDVVHGQRGGVDVGPGGDLGGLYAEG